MICKKCGTVLYEGEELKPPYEIVEIYDGKCPACDKKLCFVPTHVEIKVIN